MHRDSLLDRCLWPIVLTIAAALVGLSFARGPLAGDGGTAAAQGGPLTLWVAGAETAGTTETLARQLVSCDELDGRKATVGVLSGGSVEAVAEFLSEVRGMPRELMLISSALLSEVAYDARQPAGTETRQLGRRTTRLLLHATPIAVLAADRLGLATNAGGGVRSLASLTALMRSSPEQPFVGIAAEPELEGALATLARNADLRGTTAFDAYASSREAVSRLEAGEVKAVVAPRSVLAGDAREHRLRTLDWPGGASVGLRGWIAMLAPGGLAAPQVDALRRAASHLCASGSWDARLREDGLSRYRRAGSPPTLISLGLAQAMRLQALAAATVRGY